MLFSCGGKMPKSAVGLLDNAAAAESAMRALEAEGFTRDDLQLVVNRPDIASGPPVGGPLEDTASESGAGMGTAISTATFHSGIIRALVSLGVPEPDAEEYAEGVRRGGALVVVKAIDPRADHAASILDRQGALRVEERAVEWTTGGWKRQFAKAGRERGLSPKRPESSVQVGRDRTDYGGARIFVW
jgi:Heat induced stress protein YflT